jgi:hypothetical protein
MSSEIGQPKAGDILDAIRYKHSRAAIVDEIVVNDNEVEALVAAWRARNPRGQEYPEDPYPETVWTRRIDALMFDGNQSRTAIEVKVSKADFRRETDEKRRAWRKITHRFVYATPEGLLDPSEIPDGCGLWEVGHAGKVRVVVRAKSNKSPDPIPHQILVALAYRLQRANGTIRDLRKDVDWYRSR